MSRALYPVQPDEVVTVESPEELGTYLARTSRVPSGERGFRERAAYWMRGLSNQQIHNETDAELVEHMIAAGADQVVELH